MVPPFEFTNGKLVHSPRQKCKVGRWDQEWLSHCSEKKGRGVWKGWVPGDQH